MELIVDLHTHSHYSRATSKDCTLEGLYKWGKIKGINVIGTGDFTHPYWYTEIYQKLEPAEPGLFKLKESIAEVIDDSLPDSIKDNVIRFVLTVEISTIYSKNGKVRKIHNLVVVPSFEICEKLNSKLSKIGNLKADGRPILGLDSKELLRFSLETTKDSLFIPAHIWTPWFGMFGSKSGFDSLIEAYEELTPYVRAVETGLSSDPFMNWRLSQLENVTITSHSDAHSPQKLGREATVVNCKLDYFDIINAIKTNDKRMVGTIEFYPEEGKYHYDGHRTCGICFTPEETKSHKGMCPKCQRPLTIGVNYRVNEIADKEVHYKPLHHKTVEYIVPLIEIISGMIGKGTTSKAVQETYLNVYSKLGNEFDILRKLSVTEISEKGFVQLAKIIQRVRIRDVIIEPGYDGVYGVIKLFKDNDERIEKTREQISLL